MQIHRYDSDAHGYHPPRVAARAAGDQGAAGSVAATSSPASASTPNPEISDSRMATLVARLKAVPEIRTSAVEAAREKIAGGEFSTRESVWQLAASNLRTEIF